VSEHRESHRTPLSDKRTTSGPTLPSRPASGPKCRDFGSPTAIQPPETPRTRANRRPTKHLPCRRSRVRVPSSACERDPRYWRGLFVVGVCSGRGRPARADQSLRTDWELVLERAQSGYEDWRTWPSPRDAPEWLSAPGVNHAGRTAPASAPTPGGDEHVEALEAGARRCRESRARGTSPSGPRAAAIRPAFRRCALSASAGRRHALTLPVPRPVCQ
jgi:hypothetical protein